MTSRLRCSLDSIPNNSGNPYLVKLMGAKIHHYPVGEDEHGADRALEERAIELAAEGRKAYVIPLSNAHAPYGALGYVDAAEELLQQLNDAQVDATRFIVPSGSASTTRLTSSRAERILRQRCPPDGAQYPAADDENRPQTRRGR